MAGYAGAGIAPQSYGFPAAFTDFSGHGSRSPAPVSYNLKQDDFSGPPHGEAASSSAPSYFRPGGNTINNTKPLGADTTSTNASPYAVYQRSFDPHQLGYGAVMYGTAPTPAPVAKPKPPRDRAFATEQLWQPHPQQQYQQQAQAGYFYSIPGQFPDPAAFMAHSVYPTHTPFYGTAPDQAFAQYGWAQLDSAYDQNQMKTQAPAPESNQSAAPHRRDAPTPRTTPKRPAAEESRAAVASWRDIVASDDDGSDEDEGKRKRKRKNWKASGTELLAAANLDEPTVDRVLDDQTRQPEGSLDPPSRLFYIKWLHRAHIYNSWESYERLREVKGLKKVDNYIKNSKKWEEEKTKASPEDIEAVEVQKELDRQQIEEYMKVDRVVACRSTESGGLEYLVKWLKLPYAEATWEPAEAIQGFAEQAEKFQQREQRASACANFYMESSTRKRIQKGDQPRQLNTTKPPFLRGELRDYQVQGVNWLIQSWASDTNCILSYVG